MITTAAPRRSRFFEIALVLSLVVHLLGLLIYFGLARPYLAQAEKQAQKHEFVATSDVVRLEKRNVPRPAVKLPISPPPVPKVVPQRVVVRKPVARPTPVERREIARITPQAPPRPSVAPTRAIAEAPVKAQPDAQPQARPQNQLAQSDLAQEQRYARAIAQARSDLQNLPPPAQPPAASKRRDILMTGSPGELQHAQGVIEQVEPCPRRPHCYYLLVSIQWPDGYFERVNIPWPFTFPPNNDPIPNLSPRQVINQQPPPPDFQLQPGFQLSRIVCMYFPGRCQAIIDGEARNGGQPATN